MTLKVIGIYIVKTPYAWKMTLQPL